MRVRRAEREEAERSGPRMAPLALVVLTQLALGVCSTDCGRERAAGQPVSSSSAAPIAAPLSPTPTLTPKVTTAPKTAENVFLLASGSSLLATGESDMVVRLRDPATLAVVGALEVPEIGAAPPEFADASAESSTAGERGHVVLRALAVAGDGRTLAASYGDPPRSAVVLWHVPADPKATAPTQLAKFEGVDAQSLALSRDGGRLAVATRTATGMTVAVFDTAKQERTYGESVARAARVALSDDGTVLVVMAHGAPAEDRPMPGGGHEWVVNPPLLTWRSLTTHQHAQITGVHFSDFAVSEDGSSAVLGLYSNGYDVYRFAQGGAAGSQLVGRVRGLELSTMAVTRDLGWLAFDDGNGLLELVQLPQGKRRYRVRRQGSYLSAACFGLHGHLYWVDHGALSVADIGATLAP